MRCCFLALPITLLYPKQTFANTTTGGSLGEGG